MTPKPASLWIKTRKSTERGKAKQKTLIQGHEVSTGVRWAHVPTESALIGRLRRAGEEDRQMQYAPSLPMLLCVCVGSRGGCARSETVPPSAAVPSHGKLCARSDGSRIPAPRGVMQVS